MHTAVDPATRTRNPEEDVTYLEFGDVTCTALDWHQRADSLQRFCGRLAGMKLDSVSHVAGRVDTSLKSMVLGRRSYYTSPGSSL